MEKGRQENTKEGKSKRNKETKQERDKSKEGQNLVNISKKISKLYQ
jgi:hypothetical protein